PPQPVETHPWTPETFHPCPTGTLANRGHRALHWRTRTGRAPTTGIVIQHARLKLLMARGRGSNGITRRDTRGSSLVHLSAPSFYLCTFSRVAYHGWTTCGFGAWSFYLFPYSSWPAEWTGSQLAQTG